jgi:hypothetical protein
MQLNGVNGIGSDPAPTRPKGTRMKKLLLAALVAAALFAGYTFFSSQHGATFNEAPSSISEQSIGKSDEVIANAFSNHESHLQVSGQGVVTRLLPDDNIGSRHQRFIIKLSSGQTLLIAHNIDLAPRIGSLREGDSVQFYGEYEWNEKGGVLHWTHRDPNGSHVAGWLQHQGKRYQ